MSVPEVSHFWWFSTAATDFVWGFEAIPWAVGWTRLSLSITSVLDEMMKLSALLSLHALRKKGTEMELLTSGIVRLCAFFFWQYGLRISCTFILCSRLASSSFAHSFLFSMVFSLLLQVSLILLSRQSYSSFHILPCHSLGVCILSVHFYRLKVLKVLFQISFFSPVVLWWKE